MQIDCEDAIDSMARVAHIERAVIYVDPPYLTSDTSPYRYNEVDKDKLTEVLLSMQGNVAISGYRNEWDHLGWRKEEYSTIRVHIYSKSRGQDHSDERTEVLWMNYESAQGRLLD